MSKNNIFSHIKRLSFLLLLVLLSNGMIVQGANEKKNGQPFKLTVLDQNGVGVSKARIIIGEGENYLTTDKLGNIAFEAQLSDELTFSTPGFEEMVVKAQDLMGKNSVNLVRQKLFTGVNDVIPLPFSNLKKRNLSNGTVVISGKELERYTGTDIRNALAGLASGLVITEFNGSPGASVTEPYSFATGGASEKVNVQLRGRSPIYLLDGMATNMTEMPLDPGEIETVTIIKDIVAKAMYGPVAADGLILIKTYRGKKNERVIKVNLEKGVNVVDRMPSYTNGTDYMKLNNIARNNSNLRDGTALPLLYSEDLIGKYAANDGYNMFYPNNDFRSMIFKNSAEYNRVNVSVLGGNEAIKYSSYLGFSNEGDLFKIGSTSNYNRIVSRSNLDIKINDIIKVRLGIYGAMGLRNSLNVSNQFLELNTLLNRANTTPPIAFPVYANNSPELPKPWYGVSSQYGNNPVGDAVGNGYYTDATRTGSTTFALDLDLSHLIKGLSSESYLGFNIENMTRKGKSQSYAKYTVTKSTTTAGADTTILAKVADGVDQSNESKLADYYFQMFVINESLKHSATFGKFNMLNTLTYAITTAIRKAYNDDQRQQSLIWSGLLSYDDKYSIQAVVDRAGTYSFASDHRFTTLPSVGASWIISEEKFMKSLSFVNYLKLRAEMGIMAYDNYEAPFYYRDNYTNSNVGTQFGPSTATTWLGGSAVTPDANTYRTTVARSGNADLKTELRKEYNLGVDASLFSNKLNVEFSYFNQLRDGMISQVSNVIPLIGGLVTNPKANFQQVRYKGIELGLRYSDHVGEFNYSIGVNTSSQDARYERVDEPIFDYAYQSLKGQSINNFYGLTYDGTYQSEAELAALPSVYDKTLHVGDLKYKDLNGDNKIDDNDRSVVGHTAPKLNYALNLNLKYKGFELYIIGTGKAMFDLPLTSSYFMSGWGDGNYSSFVRNNLTSGSYPALTYNKVENNFKSSNFWLVDGSYFKIQDVQFSYTVPQRVFKGLGVRSLCLFVNGTNLYTFTKVKDVDPEAISSGVTTYPLMKNFTGGVKLTF